MATATKLRTSLPTITLLGLAATSPLYTTPRKHYCQSSTSWGTGFAPTSSLANPFSWLFGRAQPPPPPPPPTASQTTLNPVHYRQISSGSFAGLLAGMVAVKFSRSFAVAIGALLLIIEVLATQGINLIPYHRISRWVKEADYKSMMLDNMAFKIAFGAAFAAAAAL